MISITYTPTTNTTTTTKNSIRSNDLLYIYDFGNVKGFLFKNEFNIYKILQKDFIENILHEHCEIAYTIPMNAISIEKYACVYEDNIYSTPSFNIKILITENTFVIKPLLSLQSQFLPVQPAPVLSHSPRHSSQPVQQPALQHHNRNNKKLNSSKISEYPNGVNLRKSQATHYQPLPSMHHNALQPQWLSLDQVTRSHSPLVHQVRHSVQEQGSQYFQPLTHPLPVSQLRQPQKQGVKQNQYSKKKHSLPNSVQVLAQQ